MFIIRNNNAYCFIFPQRVLTDVFRVYIYANKFETSNESQNHQKVCFQFLSNAPLGGRLIPSYRNQHKFEDPTNSFLTSVQWRLLPISCKPLCTNYNGMLQVGWNFGKRPKCNRTLAKALKKASKCSAANLWTGANMKTKGKCIAKAVQAGLNHFSWQLFLFHEIIWQNYLHWGKYQTHKHIRRTESLCLFLQCVQYMATHLT